MKCPLVSSWTLHESDQPLKRRPLRVAAGETSIVIVRRDYLPAFVLLAENVGLAGFPLSVERVEGLL